MLAIQRDAAEIVVMPGPGRLLKAVMDLFPGFGPWMNRSSGAASTLRKVIERREQGAAQSGR